MNTTVSLLSAPGRSAIAVISIRGAGAAEVIGPFFHPAAGGPLPNRSVGRVIYGTWQRPAQEAIGEGVVVRRCDTDRWEIQSHGGAAAADAILNDLMAAGCERISWQAETQRQYDDPLTAAAAVALASALTERTAGHLLSQHRGALRGAVDRIIRQLAADDLDPAREGLQRLIDSFRWGRHLTAPWKVVLCGAPNVGKSSLINALLGYERAIVYDRPGTTRDVLTATTAIDGWPVEFSDTAGIRTEADELEAAGIARARQAIETADLVLPVIDQSQRLTDDDLFLLDEYGRQVIVANKSDLPTDCHLENYGSNVVITSASTGVGVAELLERIAKSLVPENPPLEEPVLFTAAQHKFVCEALVDLEEGNPASAIEILTRIGR